MEEERHVREIARMFGLSSPEAARVSVYRALARFGEAHERGTAWRTRTRSMKAVGPVAKANAVAGTTQIRRVGASWIAHTQR